MKKQGIKILILSTILLIIPIIISLTLFLYNNSLEKIITIFGSKEEYDLISCFSLWWYLFRYDLFSYIAYLLPIIITIMSCYSFFHLYRSGTIFNIIQRSIFQNFFLGSCEHRSYIYSIANRLHTFCTTNARSAEDVH